MKIYEKFRAKLDNPDINSLEVTPEEFSELLKDPNTIFGPMKPKPPTSKIIKIIRYTKVKTGLFSSDMRIIHEHQETHYDYQDETFLQEMIEYKRAEKKVSEIYFYGKRVILKDNSNSIPDLDIK